VPDQNDAVLSVHHTLTLVQLVLADQTLHAVSIFCPKVTAAAVGVGGGALRGVPG
jgi:hypothetical protein